MIEASERVAIAESERAENEAATENELTEASRSSVAVGRMAEEIRLSDRNVPRTPLHEELSRLYSQGYMTVRWGTVSWGYFSHK